MDAAKKQKGHGDTSLDTAVSLKKGDFTTPRWSIFSKGKRRLEMQYFKTAASRSKAEQNGLVVYASAAIIKRNEPIIRIPLSATGYRLCVYASGSLITVVFNFVTLISVICLHLGQNKGNLFNSVSALICTLVLLPQTGQRIKSVFCIICWYSFFFQRQSIVKGSTPGVWFLHELQIKTI